MLWILLLVLLLCSGTVSGSETALFSLSRTLLHQCRRSDRLWRRRVFSVMQHPRRVLMTVLIANTTVNVAIFTVAYFALRHLRETAPVAAVAGSVAVPLAVIAFGEMLPKAVVLSGPVHFAPLAAALVSGLQLLFGPLQWGLGRALVDPITRLLSPQTPPAENVTTEELRLLVEHSAREGAISSTENEMLQAIVALSNVSVREVMTPRVDIVSVPVEADRSVAERTIRQSGRRRLPVCAHDVDNVRGMLLARESFLFPEKSVRQVMRRPHFVPEQVNLTQLLWYFRTERVEMAVVVDEYGGTAGLVTIEDVVGWIVGELPDADTPRPVHSERVAERVDDNTYRVWGDLSARLLAERFAAVGPAAGGTLARGIDTVAGLVLALLGRIPQVGESVRIGNLELIVESMEGRRIERVLLRRADRTSASSDERRAQGERPRPASTL